MTIARADVLTDASAPWVEPTTTLRVRRAVLWGLVAAKLLASWGLQWDIQWHIQIGRDSPWIPPHLMMYAGVAFSVVLSFGMLARDTWRRHGASADGEITVMGLVGTPGFHLAAWGIALTVLAAPIDDLWHRLFGLDVTIWSPPHLLGLSGALVNSAACLLIAREVYAGGARMGTAAIILVAALMYGTLGVIAQQAFPYAYVHGGLAFHLYAILGTLTFPLAYVTAARLSRLRTAPILVLIVAVASGVAGGEIARLGFDTLQPVSVIEEVIAKDSTSPVAIAQAIARKNGPRSTTNPFTLTQMMAVVPVLVMVAVDPRRRPVPATLGYGVTLLATMTWGLANSPAYAPMTPGVGVTLIALALTILAALAAARVTQMGGLAPGD